MGLPVVPPSAANQVPNLTPSSFWQVTNSNNLSVVLGTTDSVGAMWVINDMQGWFMSPPVAVATQQLGFRDMSSATSRFPRGPRPVSLMGSCFSQNFTDLHAARYRLLGAWGDPNTPFTLTVTEPDVTKQLTLCRLNGQIDVSWISGQPLGGFYYFNYTIPVIALDPVKYSVSPSTAACGPIVTSPYYLTFNYTTTVPHTQPAVEFPVVTSVPDMQPAIQFSSTTYNSGVTATVTNSGNVETWPVITITGLVDNGWYIQNATTGQQFSVTTSVPSGSTLIIDMKNSLALLDGDIVNAQVQGTWLDCPVGQNAFQFFAPDNDGSNMFVSTYSGWR
jgi:hypothetical protein